MTCHVSCNNEAYQFKHGLSLLFRTDSITKLLVPAFAQNILELIYSQTKHSNRGVVSLLRSEARDGNHS